MRVIRFIGIVALLLVIGIVPLSAQDATTAATLVDDFDSGYDGGDLAAKWWSYADDVGSVFAASLDTAVVYNGGASMRSDFIVVPNGYAGVGMDFGFMRDYEAGSGVIFQMRSTNEGVPLSLVLHLQDDTQTSAASPGVTPFGCLFTTPAGSSVDWVTVSLPWDCFVRLMWVGDAGLMTFTPKPVASLEFAFSTVENETLEGTIWVDDMRILSDTDLNQPPAFDEVFTDLPTIYANQIGYRPEDPKYFVSAVNAISFDVIDEATGQSVYTNQLVDQGFDEDVNTNVFRGRFDSLNVPGTYHIALNTGDVSSSFSIGDDVYVKALRLGARFLFLQRSGITIDDTANSGITLDAGHLQPATLWGNNDGTTHDVSGGWYDAGDFGRYIPTAAFAVNQLLYAFEANPELFTDGSLSLPESGNGQHDLLDEIRWELDWMLKMQREDGAVHHKVTTRSFPGIGTLPAEDTAQLFLFDISSGDTAYFAATMAQASVVFAPYDAEYAARLLEAANLAGLWLLLNPDQVPVGGFQNPPPSEYPMQGGYDFVGVEDVPRMWAAAELFKATGDPAYDAEFSRRFADADTSANHTMTWANAYPQGLYAYLTADNATPETRAAVEAVFQTQAAAIYNVVFNSPYSVALDDSTPGFEYVWGSNQTALAHGLYLMLANDLYPNELYPAAALSQLYYLFGVNPVAKSYVSGVGTNSVMQPHHNLSFRLQRAVPGIVTEGANSQNTGGDAALQALWDINVPVAMRYTDDWDSWASNEPTIDANATFVALMAYFAG